MDRDAELDARARDLEADLRDLQASRAALGKDAEPEQVNEVIDNLIYMRAVEHIWSRATIER